MAKRYTDSNKWQDAWFMDLPSKYKLFWLYLLDGCDHAGIWKVNFKIASFYVGEHLEPSEVKRILSGRLTIISDEYWMINKFIDFQYGGVKNDSVGQSVQNILLSHNIPFEVAPPKGLGRGYQATIDKDKAKGMVKDNYETAQKAFDEWVNDELFVEQVGRAIRPHWRAADELAIGKIMQRFLVTIEPGGNLAMKAKSDVKQHLIHWINSKAKTIHEYAH